MRSSLLRSAPGSIFLALAAVAGTTGVLLLLGGLVGRTQEALVYLLVVWAIAAFAGTRAALVAAVASVTALLYFSVPPFNRFYVSSPSDWLLLGTFLTMAIIQGTQTGRMRKREATALSREAEATSLARLSEKLATESSAGAMAELLLEAVEGVVDTTRTAVIAVDATGDLAVLGSRPHFDPSADAGVERFARWSLEHGEAVGLPVLFADVEVSTPRRPPSVPHGAVVPGARRLDAFVPLSAAGTVVGVLYIGPRANRKPHAAEGLRLAVSFAELASVYLARSALEEAAREADAVLEADRLKSTLISSVSHELKTPLAAMTATVTGLLETDAAFEQQIVRRDLETVGEGLARLNASIADLLDLSRLESDTWRPAKERAELGDVLGTVFSRLEPAERERIATRVPADLPAVDVDFGQMVRAIGNLVGNALEYSGDNGRVRVNASAGSEEVVLSVEDDGPGIPVDERESVFNKFYRGSASRRHPSGTGLGLTIAQEVVRYHGGTITVEAVMPRGARFIMRLPASREASEVAP